MPYGPHSHELTPEERAANAAIRADHRTVMERTRAADATWIAAVRRHHRWLDLSDASKAVLERRHQARVESLPQIDDSNLLAKWQAKRAADRAAAEAELGEMNRALRTIRMGNNSTDEQIEAAEAQHESAVADWHRRYDRLWSTRALEDARQRLAAEQEHCHAQAKAAEQMKNIIPMPTGAGGMPLLAGQAIVIDLGRPVLEGFMAGQRDRPSLDNNLKLPEAMNGHPLTAQLNAAIGHILTMADHSPSTFRAAAVVDTLAVLAAVHEGTFKALVARLVSLGCALPDGKISTAVKRFETQVTRELRSGTGWRTNNKGEPDTQNADNVGVFLKLVNVDTRFNVWRQRVELRWEGREWVPLTDAELNRLRCIASHDEHRFRPTKDWFRDMLSDHARQTSYDPVLDHIDACEAAWDGKSRLLTWLSRACGVPCDPYHQSVGINLIGGIVKRGRQPGAKHDEVVILIGPQGCGKSTLCRILALDSEWFTDSVAFDGSPQNVCPQLWGKSVIELAELDGMARREVQHVKRFLSAQSDTLTLKYEALASDHARRCIFIGTSNEDTPLVDLTGNRRFLPVRVEGEIDNDWLRENIDQLIGEAATRESAGETFAIPREVYALAAARQEEARAESPIEALLCSWFANKPAETFVTSADLVHALTLAKQNASPKGVAPIMKRLGYRPAQGRTPELGKVRGWIKSADDNISACVRLVPVLMPSGQVEIRTRPKLSI